MNNPLSLPCAIGAWEGEGEWVDDLGTQGLHPALYYAAPTGLRRAKMPPMRGLRRAKMPPMRGLCRAKMPYKCGGRTGALPFAQRSYYSKKSIASSEGDDAVDKI